MVLNDLMNLVYVKSLLAEHKLTGNAGCSARKPMNEMEVKQIIGDIYIILIIITLSKCGRVAQKIGDLSGGYLNT